MKHKKKRGTAVLLIFVFLLSGFAGVRHYHAEKNKRIVRAATSSYKMEKTVQRRGWSKGKSFYRGFRMNNVLHDSKEGEIHFHLYLPKNFRESDHYALFITLPGYQGLYDQGVGENLRTEEFAFQARKYNRKMIIAAPQLHDWSQPSADQTIALTRWLIRNFHVNRKSVYIEGYSGGGETLSLVLDKAPSLYTAALMCSSQWDGGFREVTDARVPVYFVIGDHDEYYGPEPFENAYRKLYRRYQKDKVPEQKIHSLIRLDVKPASYFSEGGVSNQHGGGGQLFCRDRRIMNWLFSH